MPRCSRPLLLFCAAAWLSPVELRAGRAPEPPLPGEEGPVTVRQAFELLPGNHTPQPGDIPAADPETHYDPATDRIRDIPGDVEPNPVESAPEAENMELLQDIEAPGAPSDGEPMPAIPHVPGLVLPKFRPASPTGQKQANPLPGGETAPAVEPGPAAAEFQLAQKALWTRSPYQATRISREEKKPLLIFFGQLINGAGPTAHLNDDLLTLPEFNEFAASRLVLTKLQYPSGSPGKGYTEEKLAVLEQVKQKFKIRGFPCLILLDDKGKELERISGYSRVRDKEGVVYSSAHTLLERLKEAEKRFSDRKRYRQERIDRLTAQGYRTWYSTQGTSLLAKMVRAEKEQVILMDENSAWRVVRPDQLKLYDAEWARRKQAGLLPDAGAQQETAVAVGLAKP